MLAKLSAGISSEEFERLEAALTPVIHTEQEQVGGSGPSSVEHHLAS